MYMQEYERFNQASIFLREAQAGDAIAVLTFIEQVCRETNYLAIGPDELGRTEAEEAVFLNTCFVIDNRLFLLAFIDSVLVGILNFSGGVQPRLRHAGDLSLVVGRAYWGLGVGFSLLRGLRDWAKHKQEIKKFNSRIRSDNARAIAFYTRCGFVVEGTVSRELYVHGVYYDSLCMGFDLETDKIPELVL